jgi:glycine betaine/choline ABC-type transport system substrate-binding protein
MRKAIMFVIVLLLFSPDADACVGKLLHIGVLNSSEGQVFAEMISALIKERTGTTVDTKLYKSPQELYDAVKAKQVDISIENTTRAMQMLNKPVETDAKKAYEVVKATYEREKGLVMLRPYGFLNGNGGGYTATVLRVEILNNFPALPRVMDKLGSSINDETYAKLIKSVESGESPKKVARDFLKSKKLI